MVFIGIWLQEFLGLGISEKMAFTERPSLSLFELKFYKENHDFQGRSFEVDGVFLAANPAVQTLGKI